MKAMILAGGMSTRLYPLTRTVPKPLVPLAGEPNTAHVMRYLRSFGITEVAINVYYLADAIKARLGDGSAYGVKLHYLDEPVLLGSAGALKQMEGFFDGTFVVVGCDDLTDADLGALVGFHRARGALATIGLVEAEDVSEYGVVILDATGKIVEFQEKPARGSERSHLVNTGIYVFEPEILARIPHGAFFDFGKDVFPGLQRDGAPFFGLHLRGAYWCDIGTPGEYRRATDDVLTGRVQLNGEGAAAGVAPDAQLAPGVHMEGPVRIGSRSRLAAGVRITGPTVLGDGVTVGEGATIERSIVWDGSTIGARSTLRGAIVGRDYDVGEDTTLDGDVVANEPSLTA